MKRRDFLRLAGGACLAAVGRSVLARAQGPSPSARRELALMDRELMRNRNQNRSPVFCRHGMVCCAQPLASMAGIDILKAGGNAVDAAIATNAMLSLTEPMMCGPGGDLFAIVWSEKEQKLSAVNASGRAPYNWTIEKAQALGLKQLPSSGPLSWSVPGCISGWELLLKRYAKLSLARILEPTIAAAREGFPVAPVTASVWGINPQKEPFLAKTFLPEGKPIQFGDIFKSPDLARVYEILGRDGAAAFYQGEIAERVVKFSQAVGGRFSLRDFRDHKANWVEPVSTSYRGYDVWEIPPNGQGIVTLQILNLLETFDIGALKPNSAEHLHLLIEAKKLAYEDRAVYYADMDFAKVPLEELDLEGLRQGAGQTDRPQAGRPTGRAGQGPQRGRNHLPHRGRRRGKHGLADPEQLQQLRLALRGGRLGVRPAKPRQLVLAQSGRSEPAGAAQAPFHTIIPAFMTRDGRPVFSFGCVGGDFQPQGQSQVLMNLLDFGMSVQQATEQPRVSHDESSTPTGRRMAAGGTVTLEVNIPDAVRQQLAEMGHKIRPGVNKHGIYQGIWRKNDPLRYFGGSDPRGDGCAIGY